MKQLLVLIWCCVFLLVPAGCKDTGKQDKGPEESVVDDGQFPEFLVGRWDAATGVYRQIIFAADGSISAVGIPVGIPAAEPARLIPNETTVVKTKNGRQQTVQLGDCVAVYSPETRELIVIIDVEHLQIVYGPDLIVEGNRKDVYLGTVSEDGKTWEAGWIEHYDYGGVFPMDPDREGIPVPVMFVKVEN
jgi:hypothetical protein